VHRQAKQWLAAAAVGAAVMFAGVGGVSAQGRGGGAAGGGGGGGRGGPPDPPQIAYRKAMMQSNNQHVAAIRALLAGAAGGKDAIKMHAEALDAQGKIFGDMWPAGSTGETSRAKPEIWSDKAGFDAKVKAFADAAHALKEAADKGDNAVTTKALADLNTTCGGCHNTYRVNPPAPGRGN